jgi:uncharacterized membrane protein YfcA
MENGAALALVATSMLTSFITAAFGIGGGVMLLAVLAVVLPPAVLIPVHGAVQIGSNAGRLLLMLKDVERTSVPPFLLGSLLGASLGGVLFLRLPPWLIQFAIAGFIVWAVIGNTPTLGRRHLLAAGAVSSFLTMLFGATGPFVAAVVASMRLTPVRHVATQAALMTLQHSLKILVFGLLGFAFASYLPLITAMVASGFVGTVLGRHLLVRMGHRYFKSILNALLLLLAARLAWQGTEILLQG